MGEKVTAADMLMLLPHQAPLRLVDDILEYVPGMRMVAQFQPASLYPYCRESYVPEALLMEGLAQTAVLFTQLETEELKEDDFPLLGNVEAATFCQAGWEDTLMFTVTPLRFAHRRSLLQGIAHTASGKRLIRVSLGLAVSNVKEIPQ